jgi:hypothetical protein
VGKNPAPSFASAVRDGRVSGTGGRKQNSRAPLLVGRKSATASNGNNDNDPTAARAFKAVYCVDNVNVKYDTQALVSFVTRLGVRVMTCYEVRPRRSQWQREHGVVPDHRAFRICINRADNGRFFNDDKWPADITISRWFSKKTVENNVENNVDNVDRAPAEADVAGRSHWWDNVPDWARIDGSASAAAAVDRAATEAATIAEYDRLHEAELNAARMEMNKRSAAETAAASAVATAASEAAAGATSTTAPPVRVINEDGDVTVYELDLDVTMHVDDANVSTPNSQDGGF